MMQPYNPSIEAQMRAFYRSLSEKDRRRYAAIEALKLCRGGCTYIANVLGCDRHTITEGVRELTNLEALNRTRIRREGGGRKPSHEVIPGLDTAFLRVLQDDAAGSPVNGDEKWTSFTQQEIADLLAKHHIFVSVTVVKQLLEKHNFVCRRGQKGKRIGEREIHNVARWRSRKETYDSNPSFDTKTVGQYVSSKSELQDEYKR
jgi:hypothetical protein